MEAGLGLDGASWRLIQLGLASSGLVDGESGGATRAALRGWQVSRGETATGYVDASSLAALRAAGRDPSAGTVFRECADCPELVVVPAGTFMMGSPASEEGRFANEGPQRRVSIATAFAVGVHEVTFAEWDACVAAGGCGGHRPGDEGWGRERRPVINVNWSDAESYVSWLSSSTGASYRLLSESEWEYVARAGTTTRYWWGDWMGRNRANCGGDGCGDTSYVRTAPVGSFSANDFGLFDVSGNVWEWVQDCWHDDYYGAPTDGSAWAGPADCRRVLRGGSWPFTPVYLRSASRTREDAGGRNGDVGFRVARTLD